jgi:hypothetical protein
MITMVKASELVARLEADNTRLNVALSEVMTEFGAKLDADTALLQKELVRANRRRDEALNLANTLRTELANVKKERDQITKERDEARTEVRAELAGNQNLRDMYGARQSETFSEFVARLAARLPKLQADWAAEKLAKESALATLGLVCRGCGRNQPMGTSLGLEWSCEDCAKTILSRVDKLDDEGGISVWTDGHEHHYHPTSSLRAERVQVAKLRRVIEQVEWVVPDNNYESSCAWCSAYVSKGKHDDDCARQEALGLT